MEYSKGWPWPAATGHQLRWQWLARGAAVLHLFGLGLIVSMGWYDPTAAATGATIAGLPAAHLAFLMTTGAAAALLTLRAPGDEHVPQQGRDAAPPSAGVDQLLAQMSHELRTPLNAMIGFSEVMLRELYGPLGHARYQEYAAHISESGGQLLKSAEDALTVTETMSAVMADRLAGRCERVVAGGLVRDAWAALAAGSGAIRLSVSNCTACDIACERRATIQALQHLLREAITKTPTGGAIEVKGRRRGGARSMEIRVTGGTGPVPRSCTDQTPTLQGNDGIYSLSGGGLRVILARLLLEMQGATLSLWDDDAGTWLACVAFPPRG